MITANVEEREAALIQHVRSLPANLLRAYLCDLLKGSAENVTDAMTIVLHAQGVVPAKQFTDVNPTRGQCP